MTLVLDASAFLPAATAGPLDAVFGDEALLAPPLLWPEARSALHVARHRSAVSEAVAELALSALESGRVHEQRHARLGRTAWVVADELGWSKTYDAEYLALARLCDCPIATFDGRMERAADRLGLGVVRPGQPR